VEKQKNMKEIMLWGERLPVEALPLADIEYLVNIAKMERPAVEWIWQEMDRVWDALALDNASALSGQAIGDFYSHPVWVVNGVFSATDPDSVRHRDSIASCVGRLGVRRVADYGGGFGELAKKLSAVMPQAQIEIVEPYPSKLGMLRVEGMAGIKFVKSFDGQYDCVIAQDVLEHVEQPLALTEQMVQATRLGGHLIFANCFFPAIKCHLPTTFYLRHTFAWVVKGMGLKCVGRVVGADHALVFEKVGTSDKAKTAFLNTVAKVAGPLLNTMGPVLGAIRRRIGVWCP